MPLHHCDISFSYHPRQRERFRDGSLVQEWLQRYPMLFDEADQRVLTTEHQRKYHFLEWLSAIVLFETTGYLSFVEKYTAKGHANKRRKLRELLSEKVFDWLCANESGQPDLFVYESKTGDWFFCEVKGETDQIRENQRKWAESFNTLLLREGISTERRTRVLCLQPVAA